MGFLRNIGTTEIIIILAVVLLLFGGSIIRGLGKKAGETTKDIKKAKEDFIEASKDKPEENPEENKE